MDITQIAISRASVRLLTCAKTCLFLEEIGNKSPKACFDRAAGASGYNGATSRALIRRSGTASACRGSPQRHSHPRRRVAAISGRGRQRALARVSFDIVIVVGASVLRASVCGSNARSLASIRCPSTRIALRSSTFASSRTLPGQEAAASASRADAVMEDDRALARSALSLTHRRLGQASRCRRADPRGVRARLRQTSG
jgi:hypothetical protein